MGVEISPTTNREVATAKGSDSDKHSIMKANPETLKRILHWDELPKWLQTDLYIRYGYRRELGSLKACFWSLFYVHNELVNIWSHLLPGALFLFFFLRVDYLLLQDQKDGIFMDKVIIQIYVAGTSVCLLSSVSASLERRRLCQLIVETRHTTTASTLTLKIFPAVFSSLTTSES